MTVFRKSLALKLLQVPAFLLIVLLVFHASPAKSFAPPRKRRTMRLAAYHSSIHATLVQKQLGGPSARRFHSTHPFVTMRGGGGRRRIQPFHLLCDHNNGMRGKYSSIYSPQQSSVTSKSVRLLGSKAGIPGNPPGDIVIENYGHDNPDWPTIDEEKLRSTIHQIRHLLKYDTYDVSVYLVEDDLMQDTNRDSRSVDAPTDILSFPFSAALRPGVLESPAFEDIPDYYNLGDMMIDVPYVMRRCQEDQDDFTNNNNTNDLNSETDDEQEEERGVSGAMATVWDPEERIHMLLVHGMLHLVGHDHEEDDEYEIMVTKEEEILKELGMALPNSNIKR